jgi:hypothetical protein
MMNGKFQWIHPDPSTSVERIRECRVAKTLFSEPAPEGVMTAIDEKKYETDS